MKVLNILSVDIDMPINLANFISTINEQLSIYQDAKVEWKQTSLKDTSHENNEHRLTAIIYTP